MKILTYAQSLPKPLNLMSLVRWIKRASGLFKTKVYLPIRPPTHPKDENHFLAKREEWRMFAKKDIF